MSDAVSKVLAYRIDCEMRRLFMDCCETVDKQPPEERPAWVMLTAATLPDPRDPKQLLVTVWSYWQGENDCEGANEAYARRHESL